jgi:polysaccharide pyruvyl transferase WcaK-like protein
VIVAQEEGSRQRWEKTALSLLNDRGAAPSRVRHFVHPPEWIAFLGTRAFSIGTRIHGNIAALLAGTPALVIAHDSRTLELARYHQIPHVLAGSLGPDSDIATLYEDVDVAPANTAFADRFAHYKTFLETNGLRHAFDDPTNAARFEARLGEGFGG